MSSQIKSSRMSQIWQKAQRHRQACTVGIPLDNGGYELCECCGQVVQKQPIPLCEHTKQFQRYGFGYPLWFSFLKCCILLMLVLIASKTANELYMGATENWDFCYGPQAMADHDTQHQSNTNEEIVNNDSEKNTKNYQINDIILINEQSSQKSHQPIPIQPSMDNEKITSSQDNSHTLQSSTQHKQKCTSFMVFLSIFKGQKMYDNYFLKSIQFIIHLIALIAVRNMILKEEQYYDERTTLISKYSIILHNLPNVTNLKRKVKDWFEQQFGCTYGSQDSEIKQFIYVFKDQKLNKLNEEKQQVEEELLKIQAKIDQQQQNDTTDNEKLKHQLKEQLNEINSQLEYKIQQTRQLMTTDSVKCNKMIVIMKTQGDKASVLYSFKQGLKQGKNYNQYFYDVEEIVDQIAFKQTEIFMKQAPQPNQIIWEHLDESDQQRKLLILQGYVFTFLFLAIITVVFYFVMLAKTSLFLQALKMQENDPKNFKVESFKIFATFIVFIALFGVVLFNKFIMGNVIHKFVHMQHHAYTDKQNHSFAIKYALGMFFTTALMTIAVQALTYNNFYTHQYGVIQQQTIMFFVTAFVIPLIWWIHPYNKVKNMKRKKEYGSLMTQKQANQLVQPYEYMLGKRYAEIFQIMWFTFLYSQLIPLGSFLMLIGLMIYYWVDKYNFLRQSTIKTRVSGKMAILGLKSLDATLFLCPAGQMIFSAVLRHRFDLPALIFFIIGLVYTCLPVTSFIWELNGEKFLIEQKTYDQSKKQFKQTYYSLHPIYKLTHKNEIEKHKQTVQEFYKQDLKKVKHYGTGRGNYRRETNLLTKRCNTQNQDLKN